MPEPLHLAVALDGSGWHPAAWREPAASPTSLLTAAYWTDLVQTAERGLVDFVTIEDSLGLQADDSSDHAGPDDRVDRVQGRLDAVLVCGQGRPADQPRLQGDRTYAKHRRIRTYVRSYRIACNDTRG